MHATLSKAWIFALGLASWSAPFTASALGEPAAIASASGKIEAAPRSSATIGSLALASLRPISDDELADARGGFSIGGVSFDFGASVQTLVNGQIALQTNVQWTAVGAVVTQLQGLGTKIQTQVASTLANAGIAVPATGGTAQAPADASPAAQVASASPAPVSAATPAPASAPALTPAVGTAPVSSGGAMAATGSGVAPLGGSISPVTPTTKTPNVVVNIPAVSVSSGMQPAVANAQIAAVPSAQANNPVPTGNVPASSPANVPAVLSGVQIQSPSGSTELLANVANGQIQNIALNSASSQNIIQNTNVVLTIYNFTSWQQQLAQHAMAAQLASQVLAASGFTVGR
jgi:hypothetical protein